MADVTFGQLPFREQIEFFRRKLSLPTESWTDIVHAEHDHAFVVAGATRDDLLADLRSAVDKAISQGTGLRQFRKDFDEIVAKYGWEYNGGRNWRTRVIYETNMRSSYAAGRYEQLQALIPTNPYWMYKHSDSVLHPRPQHLAWNGLVLPAGHPWFARHYPPNGWGCECLVIAITASQLKLVYGKSGPDQAPDSDILYVTIGANGPSPRVVATPVGVDPGFGYSPGASAYRSWIERQALDAVVVDESVAFATLPAQSYADIGLPDSVAAVLAPVPLGDPLPTAAIATQAIAELLGADSRVFDVRGMPVGVSAAALAKVTDPSITQYVPLLLDMLAAPGEAWYATQRNNATGKTRMRTTLIKRFDLGDGNSVLLIATVVDGLVEEWTAEANASGSAANAYRTGVPW